MRSAHAATAARRANLQRGPSQVKAQLKSSQLEGGDVARGCGAADDGFVTKYEQKKRRHKFHVHYDDDDRKAHVLPGTATPPEE